jgi:hypothetical protein
MANKIKYEDIFDKDFKKKTNEFTQGINNAVKSLECLKSLLKKDDKELLIDFMRWQNIERGFPKLGDDINTYVDGYLNQK